MNHDEEKWREQVKPIQPASRCPKCGALSLQYTNGKLKCSKCGFEQTIPKAE